METKAPQNQAPLKEEAKEVKLEINKKKIISICTAVLAVALIVIVIVLVRNNGSSKADEAVALADLEMNDSIALEQYMKAADLGYKSGNRAKLNVAITLYQQGCAETDSTKAAQKFEEAAKYLDDASIKSDLVDAGRLTLLGDCYVNLKKYDQALSAYNKAISAADNNPQVVPFVLVKEANVYREQKNYEKEYEAYNKIYNEYPEYAGRLNFDIRKYAELARINAGK